MNHIKRNILLITLGAFILASCGTGSKSDIEKVREGLDKKRVQLREVQKEIEELEQQLAELDTTKKGPEPELVETQRIQPRKFRHFFEVNGTVEADKEVMLSAERQGKLDRILVEKGDEVAKGDLIAVQNTSVLKQQLQELRTQYDHALTMFKKQKRLWEENNIGSEVQYLNAKNKKESLEQKINTLREQIRMARIESPIAGIVDEVYQKEGAFSSPQAPLAHIVNLEELFVNADLSEAYLPRVEKGDSVLIHFPSLNHRMKAPISVVGNTIDPQNRTFKVRIKIHNVENDLIKPNLLASLKVNDFVRDSAFVVPSRIVQNDLQGHYLYLRSDSNTAMKRYVSTGATQGGKILIEDGLRNGDEVIVNGYDRLTKGAPVKEKKEQIVRND